MHSIRGLRISVRGKTTPKGLPEQPQNPVQKTFVQPMTYGELLVDRLLADRDVAEHQHVVPRAASAGWSGHLRMMAVAASLSSPMQWITGMMHKVHVGLK